jgi:hypothetical protein
VKIVRQDQHAERNHPEAENRQESQKTAKNEKSADQKAGRAGFRQADAGWPHNNVAGGMIDAKAPGAWFCGIIGALSHPQEMGITRMIASRCHFFEKTTWQIEQAFVLAHSHRGKR